MGKDPATNSELDPFLTVLPGIPKFELNPRTTALMIIDMQYFDARRGYGIFKNAGPDQFQYYFDRVDRLVIPNIRRLQDAFRAAGMEVIHFRSAALTKDARDRSWRHKVRGSFIPKDSKEAQILEEVAPVGDELVISKTTSGIFTTPIDRILRNLGIDTTVFVGVATNQCVETSVRMSSEYDYKTVLVEDACSAADQESHESSVRNLSDVYAKIKSTDEVLAEVGAQSGQSGAADARIPVAARR
jgi:nicotinamidase-related amidase